MKAALAGYLGSEAGEGVKGILMGTRKGDPNGGKWIYRCCRRSSELSAGYGETGYSVEGFWTSEGLTDMLILIDDSSC